MISISSEILNVQFARYLAWPTKHETLVRVKPEWSWFPRILGALSDGDFSSPAVEGAFQQRVV